MTSRRGSGRTYKALQELPKGGIYIVSTQAQVHYCKKMLLEMVRNMSDIEIISISSTNLNSFLRGKKCPITVDHHIWESRGLTNDQYYAVCIAAYNTN